MEILTPQFGFMPYPQRISLGSGTGLLNGLSFGVKDLFDVEGYPTSAGQPLWLAQSGIKTRSCSVVRAILGAGASCIGKTVTDEFAFSIVGDNAHFGRPVNPAAPNRFAGGSSSGSASAVAHGLVDFSLGTDTGGSVRAPASNCGIFGFRPTHGLISLEGVHPLSPSFDTCGWFARSLSVLSSVADVLLGSQTAGAPENPRLLMPLDLWGSLGPEIAQAFETGKQRLTDKFGEVSECRVVMKSVDQMLGCFRAIQGYEAWGLHGDWISKYRPNFGPGVRERFSFASQVSRDQYEAALAFQRRFRCEIDALLATDGLLMLPTVGDVSPLIESSHEDLEDYRRRAFSLLCVAGLAGLPQISIPLAVYQGAPLGLSLIGRRGGDAALIAYAKELFD